MCSFAPNEKLKIAPRTVQRRRVSGNLNRAAHLWVANANIHALVEHILNQEMGSEIQIPKYFLMRTYSAV